jgi:cysteinyl-tRNA synthetase
MSLKYLGDSLDIHGGGQDLIFPHHENEIAQSECFTGTKPFVRYWLHNGMVKFGEEKMSKSLGNLITIKEALEKYGADALRIFVLSSHYRSPLTYSEEAIEAAKGGGERLARVISRDDPTEGKGKALDAEPYRKQFIEAMDDDFNTPQALAALFDLANAINQAGDKGISTDKAQNTLVSLAQQVLGLKLPKPQRIELSGISSTATFGSATVTLSEENIRNLVIRRDEFRKAKKWAEADEIRDQLAKQGIILEDRKR